MLVKNAKAIGLILIVFLSIPISAFLLSRFAIQPAFASPDGVVMYLDPANITGLRIGDTFNITVLIQNFTDVYGWQAGLMWNASLLDVDSVLYGKVSWPESIFAVLVPARASNPMQGTIDNVAGQIYPPYAEGLTDAGGVNGTMGTGYKLMKVTFRVKDYAPEGSYIDFIGSDPFGYVSCWTQFPNVSDLILPDAMLNATFSTVAPVAPTTPTLIFVDPPYINATTVGQTINVTIKIQDFIQLYSWQAGVKWNPQILNCTSVMAGPELDDSVFKVLAPGRFTLYIPPTINNTEGRLYPPLGETLTYPGEGVTGAAGASYNLVKLTFQTIGTGISDLHLFETATYYYPIYSYTTEGQTLIRDVHNVRLAQGDFTVGLITNSTGLYSDIGGYTFNGSAVNGLTFVVTATSYRNSSYLNGNTNGFINITIPKGLMWVDNLGDWIVLVNGAAPTMTDFNQNSTHYILYFAYPHRTNGDSTAPYPHTIVIKATHIIPEYPSTLLLTILLLGASIAVLLTKTWTKRLKQSSHYYSN